MNKKHKYLRCTIWLGLFVFLTFLYPAIIFANQDYDLDEFDDLELKALDEQKKNSDDDIDKQRLILFDENLYLLDDDFDFGEEEELELRKLELNSDDIDISREYEDFLNAFFEHSKLVFNRLAQKSMPPITKPEKADPPLKNQIDDPTPVDSNESIPPIIKKEEITSSKKNQIEDLTPIDYSSGGWEEANPPIIKEQQSDPKSTIKNKITILPRIGFGLNFNHGFGPITGGSISYGNNKWGNIGADLMFLVGETKYTYGISGFYQRSIFKYIAIKVGLSYLNTIGIAPPYTDDEIKLGKVAGAGLSFPIGKMLIIQPMAEVNFGTSNTNIMGGNFNIGISL